MVHAVGSKKGDARWYRYTARTIALIWALCWLYVALTIVAMRGLDWVGITLAFGYCSFFFGSVVIAWLWERNGGILLIFEGISIGIIYPFWMSGRVITKFIIHLELTLVVPALVAGFLFLMSWYKSRQAVTNNVRENS